MRTVLFEWDKVMERWVHDCPEKKQKVVRRKPGDTKRFWDEYYKKKEVEQ